MKQAAADVPARPQLVLHPITAAALWNCVAEPPHAVLITGSAGSGKASLARLIASELLPVHPKSADGLALYPYVRTIAPIDGKAIPIESVRSLQQFLGLRVPGNHPGGPARAIIIEEAHLLTTEAQNALLKTLEEPPLDTVILLTAVSAESVLPTIASRVRTLAVLPPDTAGLLEHFQNAGYEKAAIEKALQLSGELPGLAAALLSNTAEHPLVIAAQKARDILQHRVYERLLVVDELVKQKQLSQDVVHILGLMSRMALARTTDNTSAERWRKILAASYSASERLSGNSQSKLVLTNLMLEL